MTAGHTSEKYTGESSPMLDHSLVNVWEIASQRPVNTNMFCRIYKRDGHVAHMDGANELVVFDIIRIIAECQ